MSRIRPNLVGEPPSGSQLNVYPAPERRLFPDPGDTIDWTGISASLADFRLERRRTGRCVHSKQGIVADLIEQCGAHLNGWSPRDEQPSMYAQLIVPVNFLRYYY